MNILLLGGGGREHALAWKLAQSPRCETLYCSPVNAGIANVATPVKLAVEGGAAVVAFCQENDIGLVVIGPEAPLVAGVADALNAAKIPVFGPSKAAAKLEGSKAYMKDLAIKAGVPTAKYYRCTNVEEAKKHLAELGLPVVIKQDGLAAGKGVVIATAPQEAASAVEEFLQIGEIIIEEFMEGEEVSFFAIADGKTAIPFTTAQDHKRAFDGDLGPNTGGMGAFSPARAAVTPEGFTEQVMKTIIQPTLDHMDVPFVGVLYAGLMIVDGQPKLLEYNVRFGDPECQVMMLRLESDLVELLLDAANGELTGKQLQFSEEVALTVVMASKGYPGAYNKGSVIKGVEAVDAASGVTVFHAGTGLNEAGDLIATGGRVLNITALSTDIPTSRDNVYAAIEKIDWPGGFYRQDIGVRAV